MDTQLWSGITVVVLVAIAFPLMYLGWRNRKRRQSSIRAAAALPPGLGAPSLEAGILYVATTAEGQPLERVTLTGLTFRGRGRLLVWTDGIALAIDGEDDVYIPVERITAVGTSTWAIDRAVEPGGLIRIDWRAQDANGPVGVESYLRVLDAGQRGRVLDTLQAVVPMVASRVAGPTMSTTVTDGSDEEGDKG